MNADNIGEILDALALRFGTTGVYLWEVLVRQQIIEAVMASVFLGIVTIAWPIWLFVGWRFDLDIDDFEWGAPAVILAFTSVVAVLVAYHDIPGLWNPEFYALRDILP